MPASKKYGWKPDKPDFRDLRFAEHFELLKALPPDADLRGKCPPVYDQGELGSCTAQALAGAYHLDEIKQHKSNIFLPSRLFIYYNERVLEDSVEYDSGAELRDGIKTMAAQGVCDETLWPYDYNLLTTKPNDAAYTQAKNRRISKYLRINNSSLNEIKTCLNAANPIAFGMMVYESFESDQVAETGIVPLPRSRESAVGGHAMLLVGYHDRRNAFVVRNSWGESWGARGYCYIPYDYLTNTDLADDFWTIKYV